MNDAEALIEAHIAKHAYLTLMQETRDHWPLWEFLPPVVQAGYLRDAQPVAAEVANALTARAAAPVEHHQPSFDAGYRAAIAGREEYDAAAPVEAGPTMLAPGVHSAGQDVAEAYRTGLADGKRNTEAGLRVEYRACWKSPTAMRKGVQAVTDYDDDHLTLFWEWVADCAALTPERVWWIEERRITDWTTALLRPAPAADGGAESSGADLEAEVGRDE